MTELALWLQLGTRNLTCRKFAACSCLSPIISISTFMLMCNIESLLMRQHCHNRPTAQMEMAEACVKKMQDWQCVDVLASSCHLSLA